MPKGESLEAGVFAIERRNPYQTTSAIEQFNPDPIPSIATRFPFTSLPVSVSFDSAIWVNSDRPRHGAANSGRNVTTVSTGRASVSSRCRPSSSSA